MMRDRYFITLEGEHIPVAGLGMTEIEILLELVPTMTAMDCSRDDMRERLLIEALIRRKGWRW